MGLPLYRAPVECEIKVKVPKDPPTRARSTIRRSARRTANEPFAAFSARFQARRHNRASASASASASPADETPWSPWDNAGSVDASAPMRGNNGAPRAALHRAPTLHDRSSIPTIESSQRFNRSSRPSDSALREVVARNGSGMSQDMARYFGEHMAMLHAATSSRPSQTAENTSEGDETEPLSGERWGIASRDLPTPPRQMPPVWARTAGSQPSPRVADVVLRRQDGHLIAMRRLRAVRAARTPTATGDSSQPQSHEGQPPVDGLGDRNRSLSPEDERVWDTLLSSITPDPQPPSLGTSFASTSAPTSGTASQNTASSGGHSSHTHITAPATVDGLVLDGEFDFEHPCESGGDNSDTEGEDDDLSQLTLRRFGRSYADVTRSQREEEDLEIMGGVESMQRIVRNLARREDIPDEWWAEAGLSRSLRREAA